MGNLFKIKWNKRANCSNCFYYSPGFAGFKKKGMCTNKFAKKEITVSVASIEVMERILNVKYDVRCVLDGQRTSYYLDSIAKQYIDQVYGNMERYYEQRGIVCEHLKIKEIRL